MRIPVAILSVLFVICTVSSCSKNDDTHDTGGTTLKRYTTSFKDTINFYYIYDRDANGNIISMRDSTRAYEFITKLEYGSNGKVSKINFFQLRATPEYSFELEYNSAGRISKRKTRAGALPVKEDYNVYVYDAAGHLAVDSQFTTVNNTSLKASKVSKFQYTGDNITIAESYDVVNGALVLDTKVKYEYDNSINPFKGMDYEYYINESSSAIYSVPLKSSNNVLKTYETDFNGGWNLQVTNSYQYYSNNYTWKATTQNVTVTLPPLVTEYFFQ